MNLSENKGGYRYEGKGENVVIFYFINGKSFIFHFLLL